MTMRLQPTDNWQNLVAKQNYSWLIWQNIFDSSRIRECNLEQAKKAAADSFCLTDFQFKHTVAFSTSQKKFWLFLTAANHGTSFSFFWAARHWSIPEAFPTLMRWLHQAFEPSRPQHQSLQPGSRSQTNKKTAKTHWATKTQPLNKTDTKNSSVHNNVAKKLPLSLYFSQAVHAKLWTSASFSRQSPRATLNDLLLLDLAKEAAYVAVKRWSLPYTQWQGNCRGGKPSCFTANLLAYL